MSSRDAQSKPEHPQKTLVNLDLEQLDDVHGGTATYTTATLRYAQVNPLSTAWQANTLTSVWQVNPSLRIRQVNPI